MIRRIERSTSNVNISYDFCKINLDVARRKMNDGKLFREFIHLYAREGIFLSVKIYDSKTVIFARSVHARVKLCI